MDSCPPILKTLLIGDNACLLAQLSTIFAKNGAYLPVIDGPRMSRPDRDVEVISRNNAAARVSPERIIFADLPDETVSEFDGRFPSKRCIRAASQDDVTHFCKKTRAKEGPVFCSPKKIAIGLLEALVTGRGIEFAEADNENGSESESCYTWRGDHAVICESSHLISQVIAANYAYSIGADIYLVHEPNADESEILLESLYSLYEQQEQSPREILTEITLNIRARLSLKKKDYRTLTFIAKELPWGFAFPEVPTTHLFSYPNLGIALINSFAAEQRGKAGLKVAAVVDPGQVSAPEIEWAAEQLAQRGTLVRGYRHRNASVNDVLRMLEILPYDFLLIATHCGDAGGWRWTYEFTDSEGLQRCLVVDVAIGVSNVAGAEKFEVIQFKKFVSLDGVDWNDPDRNSMLYVGTAILDYQQRTRGNEYWQPTRKEPIQRVRDSAALRMFDGNMLLASYQIADGNTPIVVNNACGSWHQLAARFTYANARAYIGTLFSVTDGEADATVKELLGKQLGKPIAVALWHAQNAVHSDLIRRPYVLVGPHFQRLRFSVDDRLPIELLSRLERAKEHWSTQVKETAEDLENRRETMKAFVTFIDAEISGLRSWLQQYKVNGRS